jgi:hypothetical protein
MEATKLLLHGSLEPLFRHSVALCRLAHQDFQCCPFQIYQMIDEREATDRIDQAESRNFRGVNRRRQDALKIQVLKA